MPPDNARAELADSAATIEDSAREQERSADRRTVLAADRTILAAERTYAAWVRTGLMALASGVGARTLLDALIPDWLAAATASLLVAFSGFCFVAAVWRSIWAGAPPPAPDIAKLPSWLLVAVNGFLILVALAALVGIWADILFPAEAV